MEERGGKGYEVPFAALELTGDLQRLGGRERGREGGREGGRRREDVYRSTQKDTV